MATTTKQTTKAPTVSSSMNPEDRKLPKKSSKLPSNINSSVSSKPKMKNGGSLSALKASNKRDKGIDPKGAFTKVQKKTLKGAKGKASLTKDKQLGATKMTAKHGSKMSKK